VADYWGGWRSRKAKAECQRIYGWTCWLCGHEIDDEADYTIDHVVERHNGGTHDIENLRPAHGRKHPELGCPGNFGRSARRKPGRRYAKAIRSRDW